MYTHWIFYGHVVSADQEWVKGAVVTHGKKILWVGPESLLPELWKNLPAQKIRVDEGYIVPGLIDVHIHGAGGFDATDGTAESLLGMASVLGRFGVTGFLPTTVTHDEEHVLAAVATAAAAVQQQSGERSSGAKIFGLHLEGPYVSPEKAGAQDPAFIRPLDMDELENFLDAAPGIVRLVTLAPENGPSLEGIAMLRRRGIVVSLGHTAASYEQALAAMLAGATHTSHTFNGMEPFHHRRPGVIGAALENPLVRCEVICDGFHVDPAGVRLVLAAKGYRGTVLVSDAIRALGEGDGTFKLGDLDVTVQGYKTELANGGLGGSVTPINRGLYHLWQWSGLALKDAVQTATKVPAEILGLTHKGQLAAGFDADLAVFDEQLRARLTMVEGQAIFADPKLGVI